MRPIMGLGLSVVMAASLLACSGGEQPIAASEGNQTEQGHAAKAAACDAQRDADLDQASSNMAMIQAAGDWDACLVDANDGAVPSIEKNLTDIDSFLAGSAKTMLQASRDAGGALCTVLVNGSDGYGGTIANLYAADCGGERERDVASIIDAYVMLDGDVKPIDEDREHFAACYQEYDRVMENAVSTADMVQSTYALSDCMQKDVDASSAALAKQLVDNGAVGNADDASAQVKAAVEGMAKSSSELCSLVAQASEGGGGTIANIYAASCMVDAQAQLATALRGFVWSE